MESFTLSGHRLCLRLTFMLVLVLFLNCGSNQRVEGVARSIIRGPSTIGSNKNAGPSNFQPHSSGPGYGGQSFSSGRSGGHRIPTNGAGGYGPNFSYTSQGQSYSRSYSSFSGTYARAGENQMRVPLADRTGKRRRYIKSKIEPQKFA